MAVTLNEGVPKEGQLTSAQLLSRLRSMEAVGMTLLVPTIGNANRNGWQRTAKAKAVYKQQTGEELTGNGRTS